MRAMQHSALVAERQRTFICLLMSREGDTVSPAQICGLGVARILAAGLQDSEAMTRPQRSGIPENIRAYLATGTALLYAPEVRLPAVWNSLHHALCREASVHLHHPHMLRVSM